MWYRTEFLLEWVWYHTVAHGVEKVFVYDNDSGVDDMDENVKRLKEMFNIEYVPWNIHKIQPAYHGHCAMKAAAECEWVSFTDIDEFVHVDPGHHDGRLGTILEKLQDSNLPNPFKNQMKKSKKIGGIELRMVTTSSGDVNMTKKPAGGVVRNYGCTGKSTNWKSIVRPRALHQSMINAVHYYAYDYPEFTSAQYVSGSPVRLYHYKNQAWEVYMRKYVRRASPATRGFKHRDGSTEVTAENPDGKWAENVLSQCSQAAVAPIQGRARCLVSPKVCPGEMPDRNVMIVGIGGLGSGLPWVKHQLANVVGAASTGYLSIVESEKIDASGNDEYGIEVKDWREVRHVSANKQLKELTYGTIVHHVRHPLAAVRAMCTGLLPSDATVRTALKSWIFENQMIEMVADSRYRVEDVHLDDLCEKAGPNMDHLCEPLSGLRPRINFGNAQGVVEEMFTWKYLEDLDPLGARQAMEMADRYGYTVHEAWWHGVANKVEVLVRGGERRVE